MSELYQGCVAIELTLRAIQRYGERTAIICGEEKITYRAMGERIESR